jgi:hypothetical protein
MFDVRDGLLHHQPGEFSAFGHENVNVVFWHNSLSVATVRAADRVHARRGAELGRKLSFVSVLSARVAFPDSDVRAEVHALQARWRASIGCFVAVVEADGMWRSAARGFLTALQAVAPESDGRLHLSSTLGAAAAWLVEPHARMTGVRLDRAALNNFFEGARRAAASGLTVSAPRSDW